MEFDDNYFEQKDTAEPEPPRRRKRARCRANPFIDAEAGVDWDVSGDEGTNDENDYLDGCIVADDILY